MLVAAPEKVQARKPWQVKSVIQGKLRQFLESELQPSSPLPFVNMIRLYFAHVYSNDTLHSALCNLKSALESTLPACRTQSFPSRCAARPPLLCPSSMVS